ncbi:DMT family transporter [uncultured Kocuria sp.]|uniref:DMT family transporter n=1 Tax=uncultured Kocuria sp. TaxID=259305 RepID=UPI002622CB12|nr:DMT family transporter [uncultured Kocuria sp.]
MSDSTPSSVASALGPVLAVLAGSALAVQSRINGALGTQLGDPVAAAFAAVVVGVTAVTAVSVLSAAGRQGLRKLVRQLREGHLSWWFLLAGLIGAVFVFAQTLTADTLGVSVLLLAVVVGQSLGGLAVDRWGIGPAGIRRVTGLRVLGTALVVAAVLLAVSPRLGQAAGGVTALVLLPLLAGTLMPLQTAMNGRIGAAAGTPVTPALTNFLAAAAGLGVATAVHRAVADPPPWTWPGPSWLWVGGLLGAVVVGASAVLARSIGVLQTSLGLVTGMLLGGLAIDLLLPAPGAVVAPLTVAGTLLTLVGLAVAAWPGKSGTDEP